MQLHLDGVFVGTLSDYGYETPWAIARIAPVAGPVTTIRRLQK